MAWPADVADGQVILAAQINAIRNSVQTWPGDVDAGAYKLTNAGGVWLAAIAPAAADAPLMFGPGTGRRVSWWAGAGNYKFGIGLLDVSGQVTTRFHAPDAYSADLFQFGTMATADGTTFASRFGISISRIQLRGGIEMTDLPSANPGAGTKRLWYDPADGNRVKFAV